jgi:hypothetical protein
MPAGGIASRKEHRGLLVAFFGSSRQIRIRSSWLKGICFSLGRTSYGSSEARVLVRLCRHLAPCARAAVETLNHCLFLSPKQGLGHLAGLDFPERLVDCDS